MGIILAVESWDCGRAYCATEEFPLTWTEAERGMLVQTLAQLGPFVILEVFAGMIW